MDKSAIKIQFAFHSRLPDKWTVETMWAEQVVSDPDHYATSSHGFTLGRSVSTDVKSSH
jgi:hypothetical protein